MQDHRRLQSGRFANLAARSCLQMMNRWKDLDRVCAANGLPMENFYFLGRIKIRIP